MTARRPAVIFTIACLTAALIWLPFLIAQLRFAADPDLFDPDMWTLYGFFRFYDPRLFPRDYAADYYFSLWTPPGYKLLQYLWAQFADPLILHRALAPVLWLAGAPLVFFSGKRLGGRANGWATLLIYLCSSIFLFRAAGGTPHSFGFLLAWWIVAALLAGRPKSLALCTLASAAFYPVIAPIAGLTLACWLIFPRLAPALPEIHWPLPRKLSFLAMTAFVTLLLAIPVLSGHATTEYGRRINLLTERQAFPEAGNGLAMIPPFEYMLKTYLLQHGTRWGMDGSNILTMGLLFVLLAGMLMNDPRDRRPANLHPFIYSVAALFFASLLVAPENAYRAIYPAAVLITLFLPLALRRICKRILPKGHGIAFALLTLAYAASIAKAQPEASGYLYRLQDYQKHALEFVRALPEDTLIAGWPGDASGKIAETIPYIARRQVLVTWESHAIIHAGYILAMRDRMNAVTDAYLARDIGPLIALRDRFNVDYLIVNEADFKEKKPPSYIEPFNRRARLLWEKSADKPFIVLKLAKTISVYSRDGIVILDLRRL